MPPGSVHVAMLDSLLMNSHLCFRSLSTPSGYSVGISRRFRICPLYSSTCDLECGRKHHCIPFQILTRTLRLIRQQPRPYCYFHIPTPDVFPHTPSTPSRVVSVGFHAHGLSCSSYKYIRLRGSIASSSSYCQKEAYGNCRLHPTGNTKLRTRRPTLGI